jgi:sarcosine oxidase subunit alpha
MLREKFFKLHAKKIVIATGAYEKTLVFENNDLPGVFGAGGAQTLMNVHGVRPGDCGVMVGAGNVGLIVSYQLLQAGINVNAVVEAMPRIGGYVVHAAKIRRAGVPILTSHTVVKAYGNKKVEGVKIARLDEKWRVVKGTERDIPCDFVCVSVGLKPTYELLYQAGCQMRFVPELGGHVPLRDKYLETSVSGLYIAGDVSGIEEASTAMLEGRIAGLSAAITLRKGECKKIVELRKKTIKELDKIRSSPFGERIRSGLKKALIKKKG